MLRTIVLPRPVVRRAATTLLFALGSVVAQAPEAPQATPGAAAAPEGEAVDARQIHWQRTLDDALAVARATGRPLFLAINMDGESASDRIVHEQYRDPAFVALTRRCVCLGASVFRHNARDHDDDGRRIPCPRFGEVTCGEHIALEPVLFAKYLADGERVAPRHALVRADGTKAFDLSLCFDLRDVDRALAAELGPPQAPPPAERRGTPYDGETWAALAARRDSAGRAALETALLRTNDEAALLAATTAIGARGDEGSLEALRILAARLPAVPRRLTDAMAQAIAALQLVEPGFAMLRAVGQDLGAVAGDPGPDSRQRAVARLMASVPGAADDAGRRSHLRALAAVGLPTGQTAPVHDAVDVGALLQTAAAIARQAAALPRTGGPSDAMPTADELEAALEHLDREGGTRWREPEWQAAYAKASLDLGRRRIETGGRDVQVLLEDAALHYERALATVPDRYEWWIERARTMYFLQRFDAEVECGRRAFALAAGGAALPPDRELLDSPVLRDARAIEALRWIGDGAARLSAERAGKDAESAGMVQALRALGVVAASPFGGVQDWLGFASFAGAIGLRRVEQAIARAGAMRYPASRELRQALNAALWNCGRLDLAASVAEAIERAHPPSADASWFCGYAWVLVAEDARRRERPAAALAAYDAARAWFVRAGRQNADYRANCDYYAAVTQVGEAMAHLGARRDVAAATECLLRALELHADLTQFRDGLGYDLLDTIDKLTEWRGDGTSPMPPLQLLDRLDRVAPDTGYFAAAVSDSALREALRADGRNPVRVEKETVDAAGEPITMPMGLPTVEGDEWLLASIAAGRRAASRGRTAFGSLLAQSDTVWAERMLERGRVDGVQAALAEAAALLGEVGPAADADVAALRSCAARLRERLGPPRPRLREGR